MRVHPAKLPVAKDGRAGDSIRSDQFERDSGQRFLERDEPSGKAASDADGEFAERMSDGRQEYYYYQPIRATNRCCVDCHQPMSNVTAEQRSMNRPVVGNSVRRGQGRPDGRRQVDLLHRSDRSKTSTRTARS